MICKHCSTELNATIVHQMNGATLRSLPGYECPRCYAIYDMYGTELEGPIDKYDEHTAADPAAPDHADA